MHKYYTRQKGSATMKRETSVVLGKSKGKLHHDQKPFLVLQGGLVGGWVGVCGCVRTLLRR